MSRYSDDRGRDRSRDRGNVSDGYKGGDQGQGKKLYVGNLPYDIQKAEVEDVFVKYGDIEKIEVKESREKNIPAYAFVEFYNRKDAQEAVYGRDGYSYDGCKLRVEFPREKSNRDDRRGGGRDDRSPPRRPRKIESNGYSTFNKVRGPSRRTDFRVVVENLPRSGSWQDLKDHMREAGDVCFADVFRSGGDEGVGVVEFMNEDDMSFALKNLDDTKFRSHEGENCRITVREDKEDEYKGRTSGPPRGGGGGGRGGFRGGRDGGRDDRRGGGGRDRSRSRTRSRSPYRGRRSRSRSRSDSRDRRR